MPSATHPTAHSLYWSNVNPAIVKAQREIFDHLGLPLRQHHRDKVPHGDWMNEVLAEEADGIAVFCDIDAVPLRADAFDRQVATARTGAIAGLAQVCNHLDHPDHIYAGPAFMALDRRVWHALGCPSLAPTSEYDAGQWLCVTADRRGVPVETLLPNGALVTVWPLADKRLFGIGTFYGENDFFHLFQSRKSRYLQAFLQICEDVCADRPLDMSRYLLTVKPKSRLPKPLRKYFSMT